MGSAQPGSVHGSRAHRDREFSTAASWTAAAWVTGGSEPLSRDTWLWKRGSPPHPLPLRQAGSSVASRDGEGRAGKDSSPGGPGPNTTRSTFKEGASSCGRSRGRPRIRHSTAQGRGDQDRRPGEQGPERGPREGVCSGEKDRGGHRRAWGPLAEVAVPWCVRVWPFLSRPRSAHDLCWLRPLHRLQGLHGQLSTGWGGVPRAAWANPASPSSPW